jgi:CRP/FNR family transcriptional regulator
MTPQPFHLISSHARRNKEASAARATDRCLSCALRQICLPAGLCEIDMLRLDRAVSRRRHVGKDEALYYMDDPFTHLYAIRSGHFKTRQVTCHGEEQITGFHMSGDLLGLDAISTDTHHSYAIALEPSDVCEISYTRLQDLLTVMPTLLRHFHRLLSREIACDQSAMLRMANMRAEQRFALFLLNLSTRYMARGYSPSRFQLRMSREDIGNYLGLTIESISRILTRFRKHGLLKVRNRDVELIDLPGLKLVGIGSRPLPR